MPQEEYQSPLRRPERRHSKPENSLLFKLRNILNIIFMIGAVAGVICYLYADKQTGIIIVMCAMVVKFAESAIRFLNR
jgi:uncharacterized membrane protein